MGKGISFSTKPWRLDRRKAHFRKKRPLPASVTHVSASFENARRRGQWHFFSASSWYKGVAVAGPFSSFWRGQFSGTVKSGGLNRQTSDTEARAGKISDQKSILREEGSHHVARRKHISCPPFRFSLATSTQRRSRSFGPPCAHAGRRTSRSSSGETVASIVSLSRDRLMPTLPIYIPRTDTSSSSPGWRRRSSSNT